jgi:hypothetical protein
LDSNDIHAIRTWNQELDVHEEKPTDLFPWRQNDDINNSSKGETYPKHDFLCIDKPPGSGLALYVST